MRATKIEFNGYRRLRLTRCNVDAKLIAFLGPNEAGKSSVLDGLEWFDGESALPSRDRYRPAKPSDSASVVKVTYTLSKADQDALVAEGLKLAQPPDSIVCERRANGQGVLTVHPTPRRARAPFDRAAELVNGCVQALAGAAIVNELGIDGERLTGRLNSSKQMLAEPDPVWPGDSPVHEAILALQEALQVRIEDESEPASLPWAEQFSTCLEALQTALEANAADHPRARVRDIVWARRPAFLQFTAHDRDLRHEYDLSDEQLRANPPKALVNLLRVAGTSPGDLWAALRDDDRTAFKSLEASLNSTLEERIRPSWHQSQLTLELDIDMNGLLQILVRELETEKNQPRVIVSERSDGLRTFLALSCFLGARDLDQPPILLIDEAETHLHIDAQADLITLLTEDAEVSQVFYTTHSPGCLPQDLGTNLRFVSRDDRDPQSSVLINSFWNQDSPGFSRLLFAMGAGAAAFSAFRRAVVCEGPSEMILLPTLFRIAREKESVEFQVAPGLSSAADLDRSLRGISVHTAFLVDGDKGGRMLADRLRDSGYAEESIFSLPSECAIEDLLDRETYLDVVDELMRESGTNVVVDRSALDPSLCIAKAIESWADATKTRVPGHVLVAVRLAAEPDRIVLTEEAAAALRSLYDDLVLYMKD